MTLKENKENQNANGAATPELSTKLTKRRSLEGQENVFESPPTDQRTAAAKTAAPVGAPFAWPLEHAEEVFLQASKKVRETSSSVLSAARQHTARELLAAGAHSVAAAAKGGAAKAGRGVTAARAALAEQRRCIKAKRAAYAATVRAQLRACADMTPEQRRAALGAAKTRAVERVQATSVLERVLFAWVLVLSACLGFVGYQYRVKSHNHLECMAEFQTHVDTLMGQYHMDRASGANGAYLMSYANAVGSQLLQMGVASHYP